MTARSGARTSESANTPSDRSTCRSSSESGPSPLTATRAVAVVVSRSSTGSSRPSSRAASSTPSPVLRTIMSNPLDEMPPTRAAITRSVRSSTPSSTTCARSTPNCMLLGLRHTSGTAAATLSTMGTGCRAE